MNLETRLAATRCNPCRCELTHEGGEVERAKELICKSVPALVLRRALAVEGLREAEHTILKGEYPKAMRRNQRSILHMKHMQRLFSKKFIHLHVPVAQSLFSGVPEKSFQGLAVSFDTVRPIIVPHQLSGFIEVMASPR